MHRLGIVGTAGRKECDSMWDLSTFVEICDYIGEYIRHPINKGKEYCLVSGGAALADHAAITLFLRGYGSKLELHLPAEFKNSRFVDSKTANVANYYHDLFKHKTNIDSLQQIQTVINQTSEVHISIYSSFWKRNLQVGKVDTLMAFTFGPHSSVNVESDKSWSDPKLAGVYPGGTSHTWKNSKAPVKIHYSLTPVGT
jgi:DNA helicase II / ATP-dependent DNA helicase PcrA